ncbi:MAG: putative toxin-antitoxin system toxin component, PIN family [Prevotellaceae bacterium]|nr:putative toxin-antitoxin system toxin component, PIN family [Prevotellaceae bacterium]
MQYARFVDVQSIVTVCRDAKDNFLLSLAQDSHADYLITGDKDLLSLNMFGETKIITMSAFNNREFVH